MDNVSGRVSNNKALFRLGLAVVFTAAFDGDSNEIRPVLSIGTETAEGEERYNSSTLQLESSSYLDITRVQTQQEVFLSFQRADQFVGTGQDLEITTLP